MTNEDTTDFDEHFAKISSYIVDTLHGVPLEMTEDEKRTISHAGVSCTIMGDGSLDELMKVAESIC